MTDDFALTAGEKITPLWFRLKAHAQDKLAEARIRNDDPTMTEAQTAAQRGRIACLKWLIALGDDRPVIED